MWISCILLTAGESSRFGSPKALAGLGRTTVLEHLQERILEAPIQELIIVFGARADFIQRSIRSRPRSVWIRNPSYALGQTSSFQEGIKHLSPLTTATFLFPVDFPFIEAGTLRSLIQEFQNHPQDEIFIPTHQGRPGHPPLFNLSLREEILALPPSEGLNTLAQKHPLKTRYLEVPDEGIRQSFNTPEEFSALLKQRPPLF